MEPCSGGVVELVDDVAEEVGSLWLVVLGGVVALAGEDGDELGSGLEEAAAFAHGFVDTVERGGPVAVSVAEEASVVGSESGHGVAGGAAGSAPA